MKPNMNVGQDELRGQMARGPVGPTSPNMSPAPAGMTPNALQGSMGAPGMQPKAIKVPKTPPMKGPTGGPPRGITRGPATVSSAVPATANLDSVRKHGLAMGGIKHLKDIHAGNAGHMKALSAMEAHSKAHVASYKSSKVPNGGPKFGQLAGGVDTDTM